MLACSLDGKLESKLLGIIAVLSRARSDGAGFVSRTGAGATFGGLKPKLALLGTPRIDISRSMYLQIGHPGLLRKISL